MFFLPLTLRQTSKLFFFICLSIQSRELQRERTPLKGLTLSYFFVQCRINSPSYLAALIHSEFICIDHERRKVPFDFIHLNTILLNIFCTLHGTSSYFSRILAGAHNKWIDHCFLTLLLVLLVYRLDGSETFIFVTCSSGIMGSI